MASSGSFKSANASGFTNCPRHIVVSWTTKPNPATNKSVFSWEARAENYGSEWVKTGPVKIIINGTTVLNITSRIEMSANEVLGSGSIEIEHNSKGSKSISVSISAAIYSTSVNSKYSGTITLDKIARLSTITASDGTLGAEQTLNITKQADSYTHTITYECGQSSGTICTKSSDISIAFTPPLDLAKENTTGTSVNVVLTIETYNGDTLLGSSKKTITCSIPEKVKPSVSFAIEDTTGYCTKYGKYVQNESEAKVEITAAGSYGSVVKSYKTSIDGKTYTSSSFTTPVLSTSGVLTVNVTVTDSRGRTATTKKKISVYEYSKPKITSISAKRCQEDGTLSNAGGYLAVIFSANVISLDSQNTATYEIQYKKVGDSSYSSITVEEYKNIYSVSGGKYIFEADAMCYDIILTVKDDFDGAEKKENGPAIKKAAVFGKRIFSWGFGIIPTIANAFEVGLDAIFHASATFKLQNIEKQGHYAHIAQGTSNASGYIHMATLSIVSNYQNSPIYLQVIQRGVDKNTYCIRFANVDNLTPTIDTFTHQGSRKAFLAQESESTWNFYIEKAEKYDNVCISSVEKSARDTGVIIEWKDEQVSDLSDGYIESVTSEGYRKGKTITVDIRTAGYVTNAMKEVHFTVPLPEQILVPSVVTAVSVDGFCLRQNELYTHGSAATTYKKPDSYAAYIDDYGVRIVATFSTTTNAVNNAPIGVHWSGTLTFS